MMNHGNGLDSLKAMMQFATAYQTMTMAAAEVVYRRSLMMACGTMSPAAAVAMVVEKTTTFAEAAGGASHAVAKGEDLVRVATAALAPYGIRTAANVRELRG